MSDINLDTAKCVFLTLESKLHPIAELQCKLLVAEIRHTLCVREKCFSLCEKLFVHLWFTMYKPNLQYMYVHIKVSYNL